MSNIFSCTKKLIILFMGLVFISIGLFLGSGANTVYASTDASGSDETTVLAKHRVKRGGVFRPAQLWTDGLPNSNYSFIRDNRWYFAQYINPDGVRKVASVGGLGDYIAWHFQVPLDALMSKVNPALGPAWAIYNGLFADYQSTFKEAEAMGRGVYVISEADPTNPVRGYHHVEYKIAPY